MVCASACLLTIRVQTRLSVNTKDHTRVDTTFGALERVRVSPPLPPWTFPLFLPRLGVFTSCLLRRHNRIGLLPGPRNYSFEFVRASGRRAYTPLYSPVVLAERPSLMQDANTHPLSTASVRRPRKCDPRALCGRRVAIAKHSAARHGSAHHIHPYLYPYTARPQRRAQCCQCPFLLGEYASPSASAFA